MPKINPYLIPKENQIKTEEIRYLNTEIPSYEEFMKTYDYDEALMASYEAEYEALRQIYGYGPGFGEWLLKTTIVVGGGFVLGPIPAMVIGGVSAGGSQIIVNNTDDDSLKKVFGFVSDCGVGIATGGAIGGLVQVTGGVLAADLGGAGSNVGRTAAIKALKATGDIATSRADYLIAASRHGMKVVGDIDKWFSLCKDLGIATNEAEKHLQHVREGHDYKSWCKVCNA